LILAEDEIMGQIERWKKSIVFDNIQMENADSEGILEVIDRTVKSDPNQGQPSITNGSTDLTDNILVYPFPSFAENREEPMKGSRVYGVVCELTLGDEVYLTSEKAPRKLSDPSGMYEAKSPYFTIEPGEFATLVTKEFVYLPDNIMGLISIRNRYKQLGLISVSGFHVDPGFRGRLSLTAYNAGPQDILLKRGERLFMLAFDKVTRKVRPYWGTQWGLQTSTIASLKGSSVSPRNLDERLRRLETIIEVLLVPLAAAFIILLIEFLRPK